ncbi:MAG: hypothetical protein MUO27_00065, partial [Sedimentisphaerales bacterium]|nr:hypothetical protein [Sedimentisphaerales bacterium]
MRSIVLFLMFLAILPADGWGIDNNPVGRGTMPGSGGIGSGRVPGGTYRDGLVRSPGQIDRSSDLIVTGNVRGGRHFRGIIPYQSEYSLKTDVPSSSLDSFLRYSAGSENIGGGAGKYTTQPYYSGTRTVTAARPDNGGILRPAGTRIDERAGSKFVLPLSRLGEVPVREDVVVPYTSIKLRPLSMSPAELEQVILEEVEAFSESKKLVSERHRPSIEPLLQDLRMASEKAVEPNRSLLVEDKLLRLP